MPHPQPHNVHLITPLFNWSNQRHEQLISLISRDMLSDFKNFYGRNFAGYTKKVLRVVAMSILGLNQVNRLVNQIGMDAVFITSAYAGMRFLTPHFLNPLILPAALPAAQQAQISAVFVNIRQMILPYNWGVGINAGNLGKHIIARAGRLIPDLMQYFRYIFYMFNF